MIWSHNGAHWGKIDLHNTALDCPVFIVCGGPSLNHVDVSLLNGPGRLVVGVNSSYPKVRPDYWVGLDTTDCYERRLFTEPFPKIMAESRKDDRTAGRNLREFNHCWFIDTATQKDVYHVENDIEVCSNNSFVAALSFALWLGTRDIFLVGVDLDTKAADYADGVQLTAEQRAYNQNLYDQTFAFLKHFVWRMGRIGVRVTSCSPGSRINGIMPFREVGSVVAKLEEGLPLGRPKKHTLEVLHPKPRFHIVSGYTIATPYEIEIETLKASVLKFGLVATIYGYVNKGTWEGNCAQKAIIIRDCLRERMEPVVWLDADAEVLGYPALFNTITEDMAVCRYKGELLSGTLYFKPVPAVFDLLDRWIAANEASPGEWDQVVLDRVLSGVSIFNLPTTYCKVDFFESEGATVIGQNQASRRFKALV